jgi:glutamine amidotransferase
MLVVIDYGAGNLRSVLHALTHLGTANIRIAQGPRDLKGATQIILPGVGAFGAGMEELRQRDLIQPIKDAAFAGVPFLGICLGMQFLFDRSDEMGDFAGLGLLPGTVTRFPADLGLKVPHMGWNTLHQCRPSGLMDGLGEQNYAYFVHSYHCVPADRADVVATVEYGLPAVAVVQRGNIAGVQFHPEKSQTTGLRILSNFLKGAA